MSMLEKLFKGSQVRGIEYPAFKLCGCLNSSKVTKSFNIIADLLKTTNIKQLNLSGILLCVVVNPSVSVRVSTYNFGTYYLFHLAYRFLILFR